MSAPSQESATMTPSVLLVLRDERLLDALEDLLGSSGFKLSASANPYKAPEFCRMAAYDVLVLDMDFPEVQSGSVIQMLRDHQPANPLMQLILLSSLPPPPELFADEARIHNYLLKPFDPVWLMRSIRQACANAETERKLQKLHEGQNEAAERLKEMQSRLHNLQRKAHLLDVADSLTHEIKNLLSVIKVSAHYIIKKGQETHLDSKLMKHVNIVSQQVDRCQEQIMRFANFAHGDEFPERQCSVPEVIRAVVALLEYSLSSHNISLRLEIEDALPQVMVEEAALRHILLNLMLNARDAMTQGGALAVRANAARLSQGAPAQAIHVLVDDNGPGIAPENIERIFEPFFSTKKGSASSGLGLSISRQLAESFGGSLVALNERGPGAHFVLTIPIRESAQQRPAKSSMREPSGSSVIRDIMPDEKIKSSPAGK